ncbi:MAG: PEPxxWA-CTERM sorting domain-containing protein [Caulobacteraceae bacterium]
MSRRPVLAAHTALVLAALPMISAVAIAAASPVYAAHVDGAFTATVISDANPAVWNGAAAGDSITGTFTYDTAYLPPNDPFCAAAGRGCYSETDPAHGFLSIAFTLDGVTYQFADDQMTSLTIGDYIETLPGYQFDQFTAGVTGDVTEIGGAAPGAHEGAANVQVYPYRQIFISADPLQTFSVALADFRGSSADTAFLDGYALQFSTTSMSDEIVGSGAAPEPATWAMLVMGLGAAGAAIRRAREKVAARGGAPRVQGQSAPSRFPSS